MRNYFFLVGRSGAEQRKRCKAYCTSLRFRTLCLVAGLVCALGVIIDALDGSSDVMEEHDEVIAWETSGLWELAFNHVIYWQLLEAQATEEAERMKQMVADQLWEWTVPLLLRSVPYSDEENAELEASISERVVRYIVFLFYRNPDSIPEGWLDDAAIADIVDIESLADWIAKKDSEIDRDCWLPEFNEILTHTEKQLIERRKTHEGFPLRYELQHVLTRGVLEALGKERFFPRRVVETQGLTIRLPKGGGINTQESENFIHIRIRNHDAGNDLDVQVENGELIINRASFGAVGYGDTIDLITPGKVLVNNQVREEIINEEEREVEGVDKP